MEEHGAGIQISPNAWHILNGLGLGKALRKAADMPRAILMMNAHNGKTLAQLPLGAAFEDKYLAPYLVLHRADLQLILFEAIGENPDIEFHPGHEIIDATSHSNGVTALVQTGIKPEISERTCDILIGADGVHSRIRKDALELPGPVYSGKTAWRALLPAASVSDPRALENTMVWLGTRAHAITYPIRNGTELNVVAVTHETQAEKTRGISPEDLSRKFVHWHEDFKSVFSRKALWTGWPLFEVAKPDVFVRGNIVLVGDAAHAMLPFAAQGAAQAIEDAAILANSLRAHENPGEALKAYERQRAPRIKRVVKTARSNGRIYHLSPPFSLARNMALKTLPGEKLLNKQDWIYRWKV